MPRVKRSKSEEKLEYGLEVQLRQANFTRRKRDYVQTVKDELVEAGEDLRDWPPKRIQSLITNGFLGF